MENEIMENEKKLTSSGVEGRYHGFKEDLIDESAKLMGSPDYKKRFIAEYIQTKVRYERLKIFNTKIEAARRTEDYYRRNEIGKVELPKHDCPDNLLSEQQSVMGQYLHLLEVRAVIEGIDLSAWL